MQTVLFRIGDIEVHAEWNDSETARLIYDALPLDARGNYWAVRSTSRFR